MNRLMKSINSKVDVNRYTTTIWIESHGKEAFELYLWVNKKHMLARIGVCLLERDRKQELDKKNNQLSLF